MSAIRRRLLDDTYKKTASGNPIIARTVARMNPEINVYGWTKQDGTTGAQLLDTTGIAPYVYEWNWMQRLDDGSILVNSQLRDEYHLTQEKQISLPNGTYYATTGRNDIRLVIMVFIDGQEEPEYYLNRGFTVDDTVLSVQWRLQINPNIEGIENEIIYPMINAGSTALPWEPYTGGAPAPSPEYPIPYYSAGTATEYGDYVVNVNITGRNLFDASLFTDEDLSQTIVTNNGDGSFTVAGSYTEWNNIHITKVIQDEMVRTLYHPGTLHFDCENVTYPYFEINFYKNDTKVLTVSNSSYPNSTINIPEDYFEDDANLYVSYVIYSDAEEAFKSGTFRPMIYYNGNGDFEPYREPQSFHIPMDHQLSKWDKIVIGSNGYGIVSNTLHVSDIGKSEESGRQYYWTLYGDAEGSYKVGDTELFCVKLNAMNETDEHECISNKFISQEYLTMGSTENTGCLVANDRIFARIKGVDNLDDFYELVQDAEFIINTQGTTIPVPMAMEASPVYTYNPSTAVFNCQNCDMDFTYKTRKSVENYDLSTE